MNLTGEELVKVIRACKSANVESLKIGEVEIKFKLDLMPKNYGQSALNASENVNHDLSSKDEGNTQLSLLNTKEASPNSENQQNNKEEDPFEDELSLALSDPLAWEEKALSLAEGNA